MYEFLASQPAAARSSACARSRDVANDLGVEHQLIAPRRPFADPTCPPLSPHVLDVDRRLGVQHMRSRQRAQCAAEEGRRA